MRYRRPFRVPAVEGKRTKDRKSTRLNSSHSQISYAVFCLKKKNKDRFKLARRHRPVMRKRRRERAILTTHARLHCRVIDCHADAAHLQQLGYHTPSV